jgi:subtilisin-like proprotein convertase family protein
VLTDNKYFNIYVQQGGSSGTAKLQLGIAHTYIGDLRIWVGVEGGREVLIWDRAGGSADNIYREWDLLALGFTASDLPPSSSRRWYVRIMDEARGDEGRLEYFRIVYQGQTYESQDHPYIRDLQEVRAWIPSGGGTGGSSGTAEIAQLIVAKDQYNIGETVTILYIVKNTGNTKLDLRMVIEIINPQGEVVYDSHRVNEDKRYVLEGKEFMTDTLRWRIPADARAGTYEIRASLRDWNNWDKIYDYRWGNKPGPRFAVSLWQTLLSNRIQGPDNTEVLYKVEKQGNNRVNQEQLFRFTITITDKYSEEPRDSSPFIRGGKLYVCYARRTGPNVRASLLPGSPNTEFYWYLTEYRQWMRVSRDDYKNALNERGSREIAQRVAENALLGAISMGTDQILRSFPEFYSWLKGFSENMVNIIFTWLGINILPEYKDPSYPDSFGNIFLNRNDYVCQEVIIVTEPRYATLSGFKGVTGWSAEYVFTFPYSGNQEIISWFYIQYDRVGAPDAYVKLPREQKIVINISP